MGTGPLRFSVFIETLAQSIGEYCRAILCELFDEVQQRNAVSYAEFAEDV